MPRVPGMPGGIGAGTALAMPAGCLPQPEDHPVRIAYVTETFPPEINGVSLAAERAVLYLRGAGHAVQLIRPRRAGEAACRDDTEWRCGTGPLPLAAGPRWGWATPGMLRDLWQSQGGLPDVVHVTTPGPLGWAALRAAQAEGIATSADYRASFHADCGPHGLGWTEAVVHGYLRRLHAMVDRTFVPGAGLARELARLGLERLEVLGRGVDAQLFSPERRDGRLRRDWHAGPDNPVLLHVGRLVPEGHAELALQTFERLSARRPGLRMVVVGDGPLRARLQRAHPRARFVGAHSGMALARHFASADVLLFPVPRDSFGNATLEGLASGLVVAAFDTGAAADHVRDGVSGCLAPPCDGLEAADALLGAAARALAAAAPGGSMRRAARQAACEAGWEPVLGRFEQQLLQLAGTGGARAAAA